MIIIVMIMFMIIIIVIGKILLQDENYNDYIMTMMILQGTAALREQEVVLHEEQVGREVRSKSGGQLIDFEEDDDDDDDDDV